MSRTQRTVCWLVAVLVAGAAGGLVASIAPPRLRLIGLFAVALGAALGWLAGRMAVSLRMPSQRVAFIGGLLAGVSGCTVVTLLHWQAYSKELQAAETPGIGQALVARMLDAAEEQAPGNPESQAAMAEFRDSTTRALDESRRRRSFTGYLSHRTAGIGLQGTAGAVLWTIELLLAGLTGAFVARRSVAQPFCTQCDEFLAVSRRQQLPAPPPESLTEFIQLPVETAGSETLGGAVSVELLTCHCRETAAWLYFRAAGGPGGHSLSGSCEIAAEDVERLTRGLDEVDQIGRKS